MDGVLKEALFPQLHFQKRFLCRCRETVVPNSNIAFTLKGASFKSVVTNLYITVKILNEDSNTDGLSFYEIG
jgi:hypothetical protein